ncbi:MAG: hypothetical protein Q8P93_00975 [bacterium]|nr:hypothetical protein [bacterium]
MVNIKPQQADTTDIMASAKKVLDRLTATPGDIKECMDIARKIQKLVESGKSSIAAIHLVLAGLDIRGPMSTREIFIDKIRKEIV